MRLKNTRQQLTEMMRNDLIRNIPVKPNKLIITAQVETPDQVQLAIQIIRDDLNQPKGKLMSSLLINYQKQLLIEKVYLSHLQRH